MIDPKLLEYASTDRQREVLQAVIDHGGQSAAARALGIAKNAVDEKVAAAKKRAAKQGWSPEHDMTRTVPDGYQLKGTSTLYDDSGAQRLQWVKTNVDYQRQMEIIQQAIKACLEEIPPEQVVPDRTKGSNRDLVNLHILTDYHIGQLSWGDETQGGDWDTTIAEQLLMNSWRNAVDRAPNAYTGILCQLGDMLHADNLEAMTPQSGHRLDVDSRLAAVVAVVVRSLRRIMRMMLEKYPSVHVVMSDANHDPTGAIWMREFMAELYRDEPRVTVDTSPDTFNVYEHGATSLFFHHGHKVKADSVAKVCAERFREIYGRTRYSYCHTGHLHHYAGKDHGIAIVHQHPTMAAKENHSASHGYASSRFASVITYSATFGKVGEVVVTPEMVRDTA